MTGSLGILGAFALFKSRGSYGHSDYEQTMQQNGNGFDDGFLSIGHSKSYYQNPFFTGLLFAKVSKVVIGGVLLGETLAERHGNGSSNGDSIFNGNETDAAIRQDAKFLIKSGQIGSAVQTYKDSFEFGTSQEDIFHIPTANHEPKRILKFDTDDDVLGLNSGTSYMDLTITGSDKYSDVWGADGSHLARLYGVDAHDLTADNFWSPDDAMIM